MLVIMQRLMLHAQQQVGKKHHQYSATFKAEVIVDGLTPKNLLLSTFELTKVKSQGI